MSQEQTVMASVITKRLQELIAAHGDVQIWFMEPMGGAALPMQALAIEFKAGHIELWPQS